jgi:pimeloyl-ACP methyl ester carboxylesterase
MRVVNMMIEVDGLKINYIKYGYESGNNIVLLHGWGQNIEMMKKIGDRFSKHFQITIIDFRDMVRVKNQSKL